LQWTDEDWNAARHVNENVLANYYRAKLAADEHFFAAAKQRRERDGDEKFQAICFRPGSLADDPPTGKVALGKTASRGKITRADVAEVGVKLLERDDTRGWIDLLQGDEPIDEAIERVVREGIDCHEGEPDA
jgi:hypothetical protein